MVINMKLLEVFKDFDVLIRGKSNFGRYDGMYLLVKKGTEKKITVEDLKKYIQRLQQKYPERGFQLKIRKYKGKVYHIVDQDIYVRQRGRKKKRKKDRVPIFFDLEEQRVFVPKSFWEHNKRLVGYLLMRTLGALGISTVKWVRSG